MDQARVRSDLEPLNYTKYSIGRSLKAIDFVNAKRRWRHYGAAMDRMMLNSRKLMYAALEKMVDTMMKGQMPFTFIANITGQPAMSVPPYLRTGLKRACRAAYSLSAVTATRPGC